MVMIFADKHFNFMSIPSPGTVKLREGLLTALMQESLHPNNYLIMELKQKFVDGTMDANGPKTKSTRTLEKVVDFIGDIIKVNNKIEPGLTVTLGTNLRTLNTAMLGSAANRLIGEVVQSRRRPLLGPSLG